MTTTLEQLPGDVLDIIYKMKHQLETADVVSSIQARNSDLVSRTRSIISDMRKYGKILELDPEDEIQIQRCLYASGLLSMTEFIDLMLTAEEDGHLYYNVDIDDFMLDVDYWTGTVPAYEHEIGNHADGKSLEVLVKQREAQIKEYKDTLNICIDRSSFW